MCGSGAFPDAAVTALIHQARVLIALNQVLAAEDALDAAERLAAGTADQAATVRVAWLRRLARDRGDSPLGDGCYHSVADLWQTNPDPGPGEWARRSNGHLGGGEPPSRPSGWPGAVGGGLLRPTLRSLSR